MDRLRDRFAGLIKREQIVRNIVFVKKNPAFWGNFDMAAKRRKKHKNKISELVISMCYNEQKSKFESPMT